MDATGVRQNDIGLEKIDEILRYKIFTCFRQTAFRVVLVFSRTVHVKSRGPKSVRYQRIHGEQ